MSKTIRDIAAFGILLMLMVGIAYVDAATGKEVNVWVAYFLPIACASSIIGLLGGVVFSLLAGVLLLLVEHQVGSPFSDPIYFYIALFNEVLAFLLLAYLVSMLRKHYMKLGRGVNDRRDDDWSI